MSGCFLVSVLVLVPQAPPTAPEPDVPLTLRVNHAIARGVECLAARQQPDGSWSAYVERHPYGATALAAFTLVKSGVPRSAPALRSALDALRGAEPTSVYSAAVFLLLCESLRQEEWTEAARPSLELLLRTEEDGVWAYPWGEPDASNTQFALLGLRAARRMGLDVPEEAFLDAVKGLERFEHEDGGYGYNHGLSEPYAGITAAGLASVAILAEVAADSPRVRTALARHDEAREASEAWVERRFDPARNRFADESWWTTAHFAHLWAIERWCGLTGRERLAGRDWYREGAEWLVAIQGLDGSFGRAHSLEDTCFALLFLRRATVTRDPELAVISAELDRGREPPLESLRGPGPDAVRIARWWLAGPFERRGLEDPLTAPPFEPEDVDPGPRAKLARRPWQPVTLRLDTWTDLELLTQKRGERQVWVLATRLTVAGSDAQEVLLWLELRAGWDVWLDGESVSRERRRTLFGVEPAVVPLRLEPGDHLLAVLVEDRAGKATAAFGAHLASAQNGAPPAQVVLVAPEK